MSEKKNEKTPVPQEKGAGAGPGRIVEVGGELFDLSDHGQANAARRKKYRMRKAGQL